MRNLYSAESMLMQLYQYLPSKVVPRLIEGNYRNPRTILEDLRREDPDGYALLTEYMVIPSAEESV